MLKHAAEEFRHAFYLKTQLARLGEAYEDYRLSFLLGGQSAYHYLHALDIQTVRYLRSLAFPVSRIRHMAYLLVTYAIELRAEELYPIYHASLKRHDSRIQVQSILLEEKEHLAEMEKALSLVDRAKEYTERICAIEAALFIKWMSSLKNMLPAVTYVS